MQHAPVLKVLEDIIESAKKKPETKTACVELEEKLEKILSGDNRQSEKPDSEAEAMPPPAVVPTPRRQQRNRRSRRN